MPRSDALIAILLAGAIAAPADAARADPLKIFFSNSLSNQEAKANPLVQKRLDDVGEVMAKAGIEWTPVSYWLKPGTAERVPQALSDKPKYSCYGTMTAATAARSGLQIYPIWTLRYVLVTLKSSDFKFASWQDVVTRNVKIGVVQGTFAERHLREMNIPYVTALREHINEQKLESAAIDAWFTQDSYLSAQPETLKVALEDVEMPTGLACNEDVSAEMRSRIEKAAAQFMSAHPHRRLIDRVS